MFNQLSKNGLKCGMFVSPHLTSFRERIRVDSNLIDKEFIVEFLNEVYKKIDNG